MPKAGGRYQPLADFLTAQPSDEVTLSFTRIEEVVGAPLPAVAVTRAWWTAAGARYVRAQSWRAAG